MWSRAATKKIFFFDSSRLCVLAVKAEYCPKCVPAIPSDMLIHVNRLSDRLPLRELDAQPDDAFPVGVKHLDVEARVVELLPRGGHATQESFDKPRDCRAVVAFELLPRYFLQAVELRAAPESSMTSLILA